MKKTVYILCMVAALFTGSAFINTLAYPLAKLVYEIPGGPTAISLLLQFIALAVPMLILFRLIAFWKSRALVIPEGFRGIPVLLAIVALLPATVAAGVYVYVIASGAQSISGILLGITLAITGLLSAIPVIYCEAREFYAAVPAGEV